jgi:ubiquinone/menaquinone biosynthesis C-methylase UbiE
MKLIERAGSQAIGLERCSSMGNAVSQERVVADAIQLPFRDETFDAVVMVAVWHHFASTDRRKQCLLELSRVLWP